MFWFLDFVDQTEQSFWQMEQILGSWIDYPANHCFHFAFDFQIQSDAKTQSSLEQCSRVTKFVAFLKTFYNVFIRVKKVKKENFAIAALK